MFSHTRRFFFPLPMFLLVITMLLSSCDSERLGPNPNLDGIGGSYSSESGQPSSDHAVKKLQNDFEDFCLDVFRQEMEQASTLDLHYTLLNPETYRISPGEPTLGTYQLQDMIKNNEQIKMLKSHLLQYNRSDLTADQKLTYDVLLEVLDTRLMAEGLELYEQPLAPTIGIQAQLPILLAEYSFYSSDDVEDYLALVEQLDTYFQEILVFEQQKADAGLGPSDPSIDEIIASCKAYIPDSRLTATDAATPAATKPVSAKSSSESAHSETPSIENILTETFFPRLEELAQHTPVSDTQRELWINRHNAAILNHFIPAYRLLIDGMNSLKGRGLNDGGLANFRYGKEYYEYLVKSGPATSYTVPELKTALTNHMEQDLISVSQLASRYPDLESQISDAAFSFEKPADILEHLKQQIKTDFPALPACDYEICYVPAALEEILSPAFYLTAPLDDTNRNVIYINNAHSDSGLYSTLAHEGFPGHLYQTVYSRIKQQKQPLLSVLSCSGANEGWATYVEHYSHTFENGIPEPVGRYQALLRSYSLCAHGLLDIGINYEGWTKKQSDAFLSSCFQVDQATMDELWQVMIDNPTNYLDYCGGFVELMEMRQEAESVLGDRFSPLAFHTYLLEIGPIPFSVNRKYFSKWLNQ